MFDQKQAEIEKQNEEFNKQFMMNMQNMNNNNIQKINNINEQNSNNNIMQGFMEGFSTINQKKMCKLLIIIIIK